MKNQVSPIAPQAQVSPVLTPEYASMVSVLPLEPFRLWGNFTTALEYYEKVKDTPWFKAHQHKAVVTFDHLLNQIILEIGDQINVSGGLQDHRFFTDLGVEKGRWIPAEELKAYFTNNAFVFGDYDSFLEFEKEMKENPSNGGVECSYGFPLFYETPILEARHSWYIALRTDLEGRCFGKVEIYELSEQRERVVAQVFAEQKKRFKDLICIDVY